MPREIVATKVDVRHYKNKDDESASDASRIEEVM
jgi:hypothetical protein